MSILVGPGSNFLSSVQKRNVHYFRTRNPLTFRARNLEAFFMRNILTILTRNLLTFLTINNYFMKGAINLYHLYQRGSESVCICTQFDLTCEYYNWKFRFYCGQYSNALVVLNENKSLNLIKWKNLFYTYSINV